MSTSSHTSPFERGISIKSIPTDERVTLHRGIAVPPADVDHVMAEIKEQGLRKVDGMVWGSQMASPSAVRDRLQTLLQLALAHPILNPNCGLQVIVIMPTP